MRILVPLLIIVPIAELTLLILSSQVIGVIPTLIIIVLTGIIGARVAKQQGMAIWVQAREELSRRQMPGNAILEGLCVFAGG